MLGINMLGINRLVRFGVDMVALSTVLAGVKRTTGFAPATAQLKDKALQRFLNAYFGLGETIFKMISAFVVNSRYFTRTIEGTKDQLTNDK